MTRDLLWAIRWLRKNPLFTAAVTLILALGIGANTAVFSIVDAVLFRPLPYESSGRLVRVDETANKRLMSGIPAKDFFRWRDRHDLFEKVVPAVSDTVTLTGGGDPDQVFALRTSGALFPLLGVHARLGRTLLESDDAPGAPKVVVLSDRLWRRRYHADPGVIGRILTVSDEPCTIAGVMPPDFDFLSSNFELWTQLPLNAASTVWVQVVARLQPGVSAASAQSALRIVAGQMEQEDPKEKAGLRIHIAPWAETTDRKYELTLIFVLIAVGLVLLIACANVGSLLLSRAVQRQKEIAIRASLGAGFWRVVRQLLAESFVLAVLGSAAGLAAARVVLRFLSAQLAALPIVLPHLQRVSLNGRVLVFNTVLCLLLAVLCSLAPVLLASRTDLQAVLRSGRTGTGPRSSTRMFSILVSSEAAFAFLLLVGSGLMIRSLVRLEQMDPGFRPEHVLTLRVPIGTRTKLKPSAKYDTRPQQIAYYAQIMERVQRIPGIHSIAIVNNLPLSGVNSSIALRATDGQATLNSTRTISPQYFSAMGIPLVAGRIFTEDDRLDAPPVAIINEYLARQLFPGRNPLGLNLPVAEPATGPTVVGVVKDTAQLTYEQPAKGEIYCPYRQFVFAAFMTTIVVRLSGDPLPLAAALQKEIWAVDPTQPVVKVETLSDIVSDAIWRPRFSAWIFSVLGALAVLLTSAGIYGVVAYTSTLRAQEVGIRVALGATPGDVVAVILRSAMLPLLAGVGISLVAALILSRYLASLLFEVSSTDPLSFGAAAVLVLAVGALASARPAWKAATRDPLVALRSE